MVARKPGRPPAVMEASGGYERSWAEAMRAAGVEAVIVDPKRIRHFAKAAGRLAKNDPIDAETIAWFAETFPDGEAQAHDPAREEVDRLVQARTALKELEGRIAQPGEHGPPAIVAKALGAIAKTMRARPSSGASAMKPPPRSSAPRACDDDSGERKGARHIKGGRRKLRNLLYMPVMGAATQHNPVLKAYYQRLRARGKEAKVALIACMRKLIVILNTMLARDETWRSPPRAAA